MICFLNTSCTWNVTVLWSQMVLYFIWIFCITVIEHCFFLLNVASLYLLHDSRNFYLLIFESLLYCHKFSWEENFTVLHFFVNKELSYDVCNSQYETLFIKLDSITKNSNESNSLFTKTNYLTGFDLIGHDLWFPKRFWIFTTEFLVIMSFFMTR